MPPASRGRGNTAGNFPGKRMHCPFLLAHKERGTTPQEQGCPQAQSWSNLCFMPHARLPSHSRGCYTCTQRIQTLTQKGSLPLTPLPGRTMLRTLAHHDDQLAALGVQVLQAEGGVGDNHGRALLHQDRLQHHLRGLIVLPLCKGTQPEKGK